MQVIQSQAFLTELGLPLWQLKPGFLSRVQPASMAVDPIQNSVLSDVEMGADANAVASEAALSDSVAISTTPNQSASEVKSKLAQNAPWVWVGAGLADIWQNPERAEWRLTLNVLQAFGKTPQQLRFFDSLAFQSDEAVMDVLDEVIALDVDVVFVFERDSALSEALQEGAELIELPAFSALLSSAQIKKSLYERLCQLTAP